MRISNKPPPPKKKNHPYIHTYIIDWRFNNSDPMLHARWCNSKQVRDRSVRQEKNGFAIPFQTSPQCPTAQLCLVRVFTSGPQLPAATCHSLDSCIMAVLSVLPVAQGEKEDKRSTTRALLAQHPALATPSTAPAPPTFGSVRQGRRNKPTKEGCAVT